MKIINLTPHTINIKTLRIEPSGTVARVQESLSIATVMRVDRGDIPIMIRKLGAVENLPDPCEGTILIVSAIVAAAAPRVDIFSPGEFVRDRDGRIIGCEALIWSVQDER